MSKYGKAKMLKLRANAKVVREKLNGPDAIIHNNIAYARIMFGDWSGSYYRQQPFKPYAALLYRKLPTDISVRPDEEVAFVSLATGINFKSRDKARRQNYGLDGGLMFDLMDGIFLLAFNLIKLPFKLANWAFK